MIFAAIAGKRTEKIEVPLAKEGEAEELVVVFAARGKDVVDLDLSTVHTAPSTKGRIIVRGVVFDDASARIKGLIRMEKKAIKSDDFFEGRALVFGKGAKVETFPYLEIEADDVRASHAATVGVVDEEQLFYLTSRGISEKQARDLIVGGFLEGVLGTPNLASIKGKKVISDLEKVKNYALG
ncbi:hypothetical protein GTO10_06595 [Candidatus Saccharibacteria bacterium]|nr:hypothetical protein [Candidatus Saccharibacteria bacterium]